jgi:hypothetical protein
MRAEALAETNLVIANLTFSSYLGTYHSFIW